MPDEKKDKDIIVPSGGNAYLDPNQITGLGTASMGGGVVRTNEGTIDGKPMQSREDREAEAKKTASLNVSADGKQVLKDDDRTATQKQADFFGKNFVTSNPVFGKVDKTKTRDVRGDGPKTKLRPSTKKISAFGQMKATVDRMSMVSVQPFGIFRGLKKMDAIRFQGAYGLINMKDYGSGGRRIFGADWWESEEGEED